MPLDCDTQHRTLAVAVEAFVIEFDRLPDNEQQLVDAALIRESFSDYDEVDGEIVPGEGSICTVPSG